jgi:UDP-glucose 4-epimerase
VGVVDNLSRGQREWLHESAELHEVDIRDSEQLAETLRAFRPTAVAHLAALHYIPAVDDAPELADAINVGGTRNLLAALEPNPPERLVFASTAAVYPNVESSLHESLPAAPIDLYGRTKLEGERLVDEFSRRTGTRCVAARLFNVIGPRETNPHVLPEIVGQLLGGAEELELGNLTPRRDFTDVRDVAPAFARLLLGAPPGFSVFNVGSGRAVSVAGIVAECEAILGRTIPVRQTPERIRPVERPTLLADISAITSTFGWSPRLDLRGSLAELLGRA